MADSLIGGILSSSTTSASTCRRGGQVAVWLCGVLAVLVPAWGQGINDARLAMRETAPLADPDSRQAIGQVPPADPNAILNPEQLEVMERLPANVKRFHWDFSRETDGNNDDWPDKWRRFVGSGYPSYVEIKIRPHDEDQESNYRSLDANIFKAWQVVRKSYPGLPVLPPSVADVMVNRYLHVQLDGGQAMLQSPPIPASRLYKYRFSCRMMTEGLRHDTARAEFHFLDANGSELERFSTPPATGTTPWTNFTVDLVRPPMGTKQVIVRLHVERSESGLEDIRGSIGFDDIVIEQYPQIQLSTDQARGVYTTGRPIVATAKVMGLPEGISRVRFRLTDCFDEEVDSRILEIEHQDEDRTLAAISENAGADPANSSVTWKLPRLEAGFYRISAALVDQNVATLATETTIAVIDPAVGGIPHGAFGWTLPNGLEGVDPRDATQWLSSLGVAWVKYPCWLHPEDVAGGEALAILFGKFQDAGIQTIGMLDMPPDDQISMYAVRGRRDLEAAQLFRDRKTWQGLLEPVMSRLSLKVRQWQLGGEKDFSFLGRPRLRELIQDISLGLQGFGQPIDVAVSWPWLEQQLTASETSWQAVCRSSDPPLSAQELDAFLTLKEQRQHSKGPRTWLLLDPVDKDTYDRKSRIRDLVMRMVTVRSHLVQAAFVSDPYDEQRGLLRPDGRPDELLLPWRTTSLVIGDLRNVGALQLRSGAENAVFSGPERSVLMVWSAQPKEELIYLGENVQEVDVWGKVKNLPLETVGNQTAQRLQIDSVPKFIIGADPVLLAFRMSVEITPKQIDSFLGQKQQLSVSFSNPTRNSMVGQMRLVEPNTWKIDRPSRGWEMLGGRTKTRTFDVVLSNTAKVGSYELPVQFTLDTLPPKIFTTYRNVNVGPQGLEIDVMTRLTPNKDLSVIVELTNNGAKTQSYDCLMFASPDRQYQRQFITVRPGETVRRAIVWVNGEDLIGKRLLLRADEQDGPRMLNYPFTATR